MENTIYKVHEIVTENDHGMFGDRQEIFSGITGWKPSAEEFTDLESAEECATRKIREFEEAMVRWKENQEDTPDERKEGPGFNLEIIIDDGVEKRRIFKR